MELWYQLKAEYEASRGSRAADVYPDGGPSPVAVDSTGFDPIEHEGRCKTCEERKYVDQSDDPSVSFQTPTSISPNMAAGAVAAHENEHVRNEKSSAEREDREIVNQTVTFTYACCPECGRNYVSGGTTRTTSVKKHESVNREQEKPAPGDMAH